MKTDSFQRPGYPVNLAVREVQGRTLPTPQLTAVIHHHPFWSHHSFYRVISPHKVGRVIRGG